jgi:hypothetical protein
VGDPFSSCRLEPVTASPKINPCSPSPCGPYSECRDNNGHATCSCLQNYIGSPPNCHPECTANSECRSNLACISQKCTDPCLNNVCGNNARCTVKNHAPICSCIEGFTGDPFYSCSKIRKLFPSKFLCNLLRKKNFYFF